MLNSHHVFELFMLSLLARYAIIGEWTQSYTYIHEPVYYVRNMDTIYSDGYMVHCGNNGCNTILFEKEQGIAIFPGENKTDTFEWNITFPLLLIKNSKNMTYYFKDSIYYIKFIKEDDQNCMFLSPINNKKVSGHYVKQEN